MNFRFIKILILSFLFTFIISQQKKPLDHSVYEKWNTLSSSKISDDGKWVSYEINPARGDGNLFLVNLAQNKTESFERAKNASFSPNSNFVLFRKTANFDAVRKAKIAKKKPEDMPKDTAIVKVFQTNELKVYPAIKNFKIPEENSDWIAIHFEKEPAKKDTSKVKSKIKKDGTKLLVANPIKNKEFYFENVNEYSISKNGDLIGFISQVKDSLDSCYVYVFNTKTEKLSKVYENIGFAKTSTTDEKGEQLSFFFSTDTAKVKNYNLFYWNAKSNKTISLVDSTNSIVPKGFVISHNYAPNFSKNGSKLYFGTGLRQYPEPKDTLLAEEKAVFDLWSWTDPLLQPQQLRELPREKNKTYLAVYDFQKNKATQLADENIDNVQTLKKGDLDLYLGSSNKEFQQLISWDKQYRNYYLIDSKTGNKKLLLEKHGSIARFSPNAKYFVYYQPKDSSWYSMNLTNNKSINLTKKVKYNFYDELFDTPDDPYPYGLAGFTNDDKEILIYTANDIWLFDLAGIKQPICLTSELGHKNNIRYRYIQLDKDEEFIDLTKPILIKGFNNTNKNDSFWSLTSNKLNLLIEESFRFTTPTKAKNNDNLIWQKGNFNNYPELYVSNLDFKNSKVLSNSNPQMNNYLRGSVELVKWLSLTGEELEGLLYKPENFDSNKKYPMLVYFYERSSETLHSHPIPSPSRSTINIPYFVSNDYVVFVPDIVYTTGYPGQNAFDAIVSGSQAIINKGFINPKAVGIQGQSWGGYQVGYLVTRTNMFAAAGAGALVSNMTSAYGGIRWESGMSRMFQYEKTQSRIGGTLWEKPFQYIENSPVFFATKVETPLFMMHNDNDGAVPWYQGIEYFTALRRLNKPVWMVNYNGDAHNLRGEYWGNRVDLSIRLAQFFDHYLKGAPMPKWMKDGIPAINKGKDFGYEVK